MAVELIQSQLELLIDGVSKGVVLALLGLAITLVFGLGGVLNLAIGAFAVIAVIVGVEVYGIYPSVGIAMIAAIVVVSLLGIGIDRSVLRFVYDSEGDLRIIRGIFVTLGIALVIDGLLFVHYPSSYSLPSVVDSMVLGGVRIRGASIAVISAAVVVFAILYVFFSRTYMGNAFRTVMEDEVGAKLVGINPTRMRTLVFGMSAAIAALAGILWSFAFEVQPATGFQLTILAIIVSIVGGVTSIMGAVVAGILLGLLSTYTTFFIGAYVAEIVLLLVVIGVLIYRPEQVTYER